MQTQVGSLVLPAGLDSDHAASAFVPGNQLRLLGKNRIRLANFALINANQDYGEIQEIREKGPLPEALGFDRPQL